jgi:D-sedoheptulose 7-phosphate isomerase
LNSHLVHHLDNYLGNWANSSVVIWWTIDYGFDALFARQVETLGKAGDVLLGISTSGRSPNVVQALQAAKKKGMHTILLTGNSPNLEQVADIVIGVPSDHTQYIQETHLAIEHLLCSLVETELFG